MQALQDSTRLVDLTKIQFFYLSNEIAERKDLTACDKLLVAAVHTIERIAGGPQLFTNRQIARVTGLSQNTLSQRIAKIKDKGIFTVTGQSTARRITVNLENRDGKFWRIPANDVQLKPTERIVLGTVETLTTKRSRCTASNRFIGAAGGMSESHVKNSLAKLRKAGIVLSTKKFDVRTCKWHRTIYAKPKQQATDQPYKESVLSPIRKVSSPLQGNYPKDDNQMKDQMNLAQGAESTLLHEEHMNEQLQPALFDDQPLEKETKPAKIAKPAKPKTPVYQLFDEYTKQAQHLRERGRLRAIPAINYGKAGKQAKRLIDCYGLDEVKKVVARAACDDWVVLQGFTLSTILSATVFNRLMNGATNSSNTTARERYGTDRVGVTDDEMDILMARMERRRQEALERIRSREEVAQ